MAEKLHPSKGGAFHFDVDVDDPTSVSQTPSFSDFSNKNGHHRIPVPPPPPPPPRYGWSHQSQTDDGSSQLPSGTYVVQFPKEQIFSYPPPENSIKFETLSRRKPRRSPCCSCLRYTFGFLFILVILAAVAAVILYLIFKPVGMDYTVSNISIHGLNLTPSTPFSPKFNVSIQSENPNKHLAIYYLAGNQVSISYKGVTLANGNYPEFFQPAKNVTVFHSALEGSNVVLTDDMKSSVMKDQTQKNVPLRLDVKAPVKIKAGAVKTWTLKVKLKCDLTIDSVDGNSKILSKRCDYKIKLI